MLATGVVLEKRIVSMRRTKEQAAETRQTILRTAEELFLLKGYESVSLDEIAAASAVTRGAVHWHFQNKQGLLLAIRDELRLPMHDLVERLATDTALAPLQALGDVISRTFADLQGDPRQRKILKVLLQIDWISSDEAGAEGSFQRQFRASLVKIFEAADRRESLPAPWTPNTAAIAFSAMSNGLVNEWARGQTDFELVPDATQIVRMVLDAWSVSQKPNRSVPGTVTIV
jgi:AcrR family transcriptional regulator